MERALLECSSAQTRRRADDRETEVAASCAAPVGASAWSIGCSLVVAAGLVIVGVGLAHAWPWSTDMDEQPSIRPYEEPRVPPVGAIPRQGREQPMDRIEAGEKLHNPVPPTKESVENGKQLFAIYCALCHGPDGKGGGPVAAKFVPPPDLTLEIFRQRTDGFIYATIRDGGALMPPQAEALSLRDRWDVVNYVRQLQGR